MVAYTAGPWSRIRQDRVILFLPLWSADCCLGPRHGGVILITHTRARTYIIHKLYVRLVRRPLLVTRRPVGHYYNTVFPTLPLVFLRSTRFYLLLARSLSLSRPPSHTGHLTRTRTIRTRYPNDTHAE